MSSPKTPAHFENKTSYEHVLEARSKGFFASREIHGLEMSGQAAACLDAGKNTALVLQLLVLISSFFALSFSQVAIILFLFSLGLLVWLVGRSALLGWARLERLHRLIEEERWEIEHHRAQEREELVALYQSKGFKEKLLEEVVDVLMSDDNRLLQVMLEEELGLQLEVYEHPLKQCSGAFLGWLGAASLFFLAYFSSFLFATYIVTFFTVCLCSYMEAKKQKNIPLTSIIWTASVYSLSLSLVYFIGKALL